MDSVLASNHAALGSILGLGLEIDRQRCCLEMKCGPRRLNNVERTHLVLARVKLVLKKYLIFSYWGG